MTTADAAQTLDGLQNKLADLTKREIELAAQRRRLSFDANTGDAKARAALDKANGETAKIGLEAENLRSAIEEAKRRLDAAERDEANTVAFANAKRAAEIASSIEARGRKLDAALLALATEAEGFEDDLRELNHDVGYRSPNIGSLKAIVERPFLAGLMFQPSGKKQPNGQPLPGTLKLRHLAPGERTTFGQIADSYAQSIRRQAATFLDKSEAA